MSDAAKPAVGDQRDVVDSLGRKLAVRPLQLMDEMDVIEAAGNAGDNRAWMMRAEVCCAVRAINGVPVIMPTTRNALRNHILAVGTEGLMAVMAALSDDMPASVAEELGATAAAEEARATASN